MASKIFFDFKDKTYLKVCTLALKKSVQNPQPEGDDEF